MTTSVVEHDEERSEYRLSIDGLPVSYLGYERRGDVVLLLHTATDVAHRGHGYATTLVGKVLEELAGSDLRTIARCPFVRAYESRLSTREDVTADRAGTTISRGRP